jgi:predicted dehydrogenase
MSKSIRVGVIGAGAIGLYHLSSWKQSPGIELAAVAEVNPQRRAEAVALYPELTGYADYREMLKDPSIGAVSIGVPNYLHGPVALDAIRAGKHVMLEKPMATSAAEAQAVVDAAKEMNVTLMVGQNFRFFKDCQMVKDFVTRGELGDIYHARATWMRRSGIPRIGSWFTQKKFAAGGCGYDIGVHFLDLTLYLMNNFDAECVTGLTHAKFGPRGLGDGQWGKGELDTTKPFDVEDLATAMIKLKGGQSVLLEIGWACHAGRGPDKEISIYGTAGGATLFPAQLHRSSGLKTETTQPDPDFFTCALPEDRIVHFADCIVNGKEPIVKPEQSLKVQKILDGIYESSRTGREVRIV